MKDIHGGNIWGASVASSIPVEDILDFSASINPFGAPDGVRAAIEQVLKKGLASPYPDPESSALRSSLAHFHGVLPEEVLPGNGSTEFIYFIPRVYRPKNALIVEPAFSEYRRALEGSGCRVGSLVLREKDGFAFDPGRFADKVKRGFDLVVLANPANPTGALIEKAEVMEAAKICGKQGATLVVDEAFADFAEAGSIKRECTAMRNVVVLRSMTKFFSMAGLRLGFIVARASTVKRFSSFIPPWSVNTLASAAGGAALEDSGYISKTLRWAAAERSALFKGLSSIGALKPYPGAANFLMAKITSPLTAAELKARLFSDRIFIRDLSAFRGLGNKHFRVALRKGRENRLLIDALRTVFEKGRDKDIAGEL
ncbi:MAG: threonine-phosphate decarboxylase [Deltaproteobacteria bacterium]|nr:threonine-phosphate decarboxylase [Deltaproteobacteria bacterium]